MITFIITLFQNNYYSGNQRIPNLSKIHIRLPFIFQMVKAMYRGTLMVFQSKIQTKRSFMRKIQQLLVQLE